MKGLRQMKPTSLQDEFNCIPGRREQPNQWPRTYDCIQYSNRPDVEKKSLKQSSIVKVWTGPSLNRRRRLSTVSRGLATRFKTQNQYNNIINSNINLDLGFSEIKDKTTVPNPLNPSIKIFCWKVNKSNCIKLELEQPYSKFNPESQPSSEREKNK